MGQGKTDSDTEAKTERNRVKMSGTSILDCFPFSVFNFNYYYLSGSISLRRALIDRAFA